MKKDPLLSFYLAMLFFQVIHIFEEIGFEAYKIVGPLNKYLLAASILVLITVLPFMLILQGIKIGFFLAFIPSLIATANGAVHLIGLILSKSFQGTIGAGVFSGVFLGICGVLVLIQLIKKLNSIK